jgi:proton-translocating NADH-quinone oxidoreductase chain L
MPLPAWLLLIATLIPLMSFAALFAVGQHLVRPWAGMIATGAIAASFACSIAAMLAWLAGGSNGGVDWGAGHMPIVQTISWIDAAPAAAAGDQAPGNGSSSTAAPGQNFSVGIFVDSLTAILCVVITLVALLVHLFSLGYMRQDPHDWRYFGQLGLFCSAMLGLVLGATLISIFICWEAVGLCSYLLIGFWHQRPRARAAAIKALVMNRVADVGFWIGLGLLLAHVGNTTLPRLWSTLGPIAYAPGGGAAASAAAGAPISATMLTLIGGLLLFGAFGKSAQFPLQTWLPDAMEGPSPVSALIHAATMVAAGVYLAARLFPILTPDAKLFLAIIGATTIALGALAAMAQQDIKRVLAYSTISQLGYMMLAIGIGSWAGGLFHLVTHAFFKALLFLAAGSVILATGHEHGLSRFGGLLRRMPVTGLTFLIGVLAISGVPYLSGFASKETILANAGSFAALAWHQHGGAAGGLLGSGIWWLLFIVPAGAAWLTAFYMARCWALIFLGRPRDMRVYARGNEQAILWLPLLLLSVLSVVAGYSYVPIRGMIESARLEDQAICRAQGATVTGLDTAWPGEASSPESGEPLETIAPLNLPATSASAADAETAAAMRQGSELTTKWTYWAFAGLLPGLLLYFSGPRIAAIFVRLPPISWIAQWLYRGMYFDELYRSLFVVPVLGLARASAELDTSIIDGIVRAIGGTVRAASTAVAIVDRYVVETAIAGIGGAVGGIGGAARRVQSGRLVWYLTALMAAVAIAAAAVVAIALANLKGS